MRITCCVEVSRFLGVSKLSIIWFCVFKLRSIAYLVCLHWIKYVLVCSIQEPNKPSYDVSNSQKIVPTMNRWFHLNKKKVYSHAKALVFNRPSKFCGKLFSHASHSCKSKEDNNSEDKLPYLEENLEKFKDNVEDANNFQVEREV